MTFYTETVILLQSLTQIYIDVLIPCHITYNYLLTYFSSEELDKISVFFVITLHCTLIKELLPFNLTKLNTVAQFLYVREIQQACACRYACR